MAYYAVEHAIFSKAKQKGVYFGNSDWPQWIVTDPKNFLVSRKCISNCSFCLFFVYILCLWLFFDCGDFQQLHILVHSMAKWRRRCWKVLTLYRHSHMLQRLFTPWIAACNRLSPYLGLGFDIVVQLGNVQDCSRLCSSVVASLTPQPPWPHLISDDCLE